jgi:ligand-binding SRPBCC domain-containing protein
MTAPVSIARAFEIFENPYNLAKLTPAWLNFRVVSREEIVMRAGAEIDYVIRWMGFPIRWKTRITAYDPPLGFVDEQESGPYRLWRHQHTLQETATGTVVSDCVTYQLPLGILGGIAHRLTVKRQLLEIFRFRQRAIAEMLEAPGVRFDEPVIRPVA